MKPPPGIWQTCLSVLGADCNKRKKLGIEQPVFSNVIVTVKAVIANTQGMKVVIDNA